MPQDLGYQQARLRDLKSLWLSGPVDRVDWLSRGLVELHLEGIGVRTLRGLPSKLEVLDVCASPISAGEGFPSSLRVLDLQSTKLVKVPLPPEKIQDLRLGGTDLTGFRFESFPASLETLELASSPALEGGLPTLNEELRTLVVVGYLPSKLLGSLPPDLDSLVLEATTAPELSQLPRSLQHLALLRNDALSRVEWPENLSTLWIDRMLPRTTLKPLPDTLEALKIQRSLVAQPDRWPPHLRRLELHSTHLTWTATPRMPRTLNALILDNSAIPDGIELPPGLETVTLRFAGQATEAYVERMLGSLEQVRTSLVSLSLDRVPDGEDLTGFSSLRSLTLQTAEDLAELKLPASLETLEIHGQIEDLPSPLPKSLKKLDLSGCAALKKLPDLSQYQKLEKLYLRNTGLASLPKLPGNLQRLDLSGTGIRALEKLPAGLRELTLSVGQVRALGDLPAKLCTLRFLPEGSEAPCLQSDLDEWWKDGVPP